MLSMSFLLYNLPVDCHMLTGHRKNLCRLMIVVYVQMSGPVVLHLQKHCFASKYLSYTETLVF